MNLVSTNITNTIGIQNQRITYKIASLNYQVLLHKFIIFEQQIDFAAIFGTILSTLYQHLVITINTINYVIVVRK